MKQLLTLLMCLMIINGCTTQNDGVEFSPEDIRLDQEVVNIAIQNMHFDSIISENLSLIHEINGVSLDYQSSHPDVLSHLGVINQGLFDVEVLWTVTFTYQTYTESKTYPIIIKGRTWTVNDIIEQDFQILALNSDVVDSDIHLPRTGTYGSVITWSSSHPHVVSNQGRYYAPLDEETITLTATLYYETEMRSKSFSLRVKPITDEMKVNMAYAMLMIQVPITQDIVLSSRGYFGVSITWHSSHPEILNSHGKFIKPIGDVMITLTATLTSNTASTEKVFEINIVGENPIDLLNEALIHLEPNHGIEVLFTSIELPQNILNHVSIEWESSHEEILSSTGVLTLPQKTTSVSLTAHLRVNDSEVAKTFTYLFIGTEDTQSQYEPQHLNERILNLNSPYFIDSGIDLTLGVFDNILMKDHHLVLLSNELQGSYISPIYVSQSFTRINAIWGSITHPEARTQFHLRSMINGQWSPWTLMGDWGYGGENLPPNLTYQVNESSQLQYKITLSRSSAQISSPRVHSVSLNYVLLEPHFQFDLNSLPNHVIYDLPQLRQADTIDTSLWNNICWGTSISMVLQHLGKLNHMHVPQEYYAPLIRQGTLQYGTTKNDIGATQFGVYVSVVEFLNIEMLLSMVYHHGPVVVGVSKGDSPTGKFGPLTFSSGHVIVVVGYTIKVDGTIDIIVNDPAVSWIREPFTGSSQDFMLVWDKGGVILTNP